MQQYNQFLLLKFNCDHATVLSNGRDDESDNDTPGDLQPGAIVGIVFGLLIVLVLGVATVVVALYLMRHRRSGGKYSATNGSGLGKALPWNCVERKELSV